MILILISVTTCLWGQQSSKFLKWKNQASSIPKQEGEEGASIKLIQTQEVMKEIEKCKTHTWSMPPFSSRMKRSSRIELKYVVKPVDVRSFSMIIYPFKIASIRRKNGIKKMNVSN